jgi:hypothetical protein
LSSWIGSASISARKPIDFDAPGLELLRDDVSGAVFFVAQLRVRVNIAANRLDFGFGVTDLGNDFHEGSFVLWQGAVPPA